MRDSWRTSTTRIWINPIAVDPIARAVLQGDVDRAGIGTIVDGDDQRLGSKPRQIIGVAVIVDQIVAIEKIRIGPNGLEDLLLQCLPFWAINYLSLVRGFHHKIAVRMQYDFVAHSPASLYRTGK